jgi:protein tyrosine phosphatase (PTP) superfamily phosphohydrolase (DUF442 family)
MQSGAFILTSGKNVLKSRPLMTTKFKTCRNLAIAAALAGALSLAGFVVHLVARHNFHSVSDGRVYRSAQMSSASLASAIRELGIRSVVNLRGDNTGADWYEAEINTAQQLDVRHFDFDLSAGREVTDAQMEKILATIDHAPKPVLIHCKNGADRSGLVGALYLYGLERQSAGEAGKQLTIFCGHIPYLFWRDTVAMDRSYWRYVHNHIQKPLPDTAQVRY